MTVNWDGELVSRAREPSRPPPDRSEEFLVHPAIATLVTQQAKRAGGEAWYALVRYDHHYRLIVPLPRGHLAVSIAPAGRPVMLSGPIRQLTARLRDEDPVR